MSASSAVGRASRLDTETSFAQYVSAWACEMAKSVMSKRMADVVTARPYCGIVMMICLSGAERTGAWDVSGAGAPACSAQAKAGGPVGGAFGRRKDAMGGAVSVVE
jgi:hypothetical protein